MKTTLTILFAAGTLAGCASHPVDKITSVFHKSEPAAVPSAAKPTDTPSMSKSTTLAGYKHDLANRIADANSGKVYSGRPQALLRSVIVVKYSVDASGNLARSEIIRSNHDGDSETTALASLRKTAPFPRPASHLLSHGRVEIAETWLFNNDGRFQLRTIALPQMDE